MKFAIFLFALILVGSHAMKPEVYWKSMLPNSPMPKAIKDLVPTEWIEQKSTLVKVEAGGVTVNSGTPGKSTSVGVGNGGVSVNTIIAGRPVNVVVLPPGPNPFVYNYAASENQLKDNPNVALFFTEKDLHQGMKMRLHFTKHDNRKAMFLPRQVADSIPFSSKKLPEIYKRFSVKSNSPEAEIMKQTLIECESKGIDGEEIYCATSLESMIDFSTRKLGKRVKVVSTEVKPKTSTPLQRYTIVGSKKLAADKVVACHKQNFPFAIFYCHKTDNTEAYVVSLVGADGTKAKAVAVCHTDTSKWNPKHLAFLVLKVKPGTVPVCHFLPEDHVVWVPY